MGTRRKFIRQVVLSGTGLALLSTCGRKDSTTSSGIDADAIKRLREKLQGHLLVVADSEYEMARRVASWNPAMDKHPQAIALCAHPDDVARSLEFAQENHLAIATRSGGHSFLGWGTCDGGIIIDLSLIKNITIDPKKLKAHAGAGVRAQELVASAAQHGLAPVLGECGIVGIAGLTLGGGLGWLSGKYGAACDNLLSAHLITPDSRAIHADGNTNPDLFWGIRGGGGNFGIATNLEYRLHPVNEVIAGGYTYALEDAQKVLRFFRDFMTTAPDELQTLAYLYPAGKGFLQVVVVYQGDGSKAEALLKPFTTIATVLRNTVTRRPYTETFTMPPYGEFAPTTYSYTKGIYLERLSDEAIDIALERFRQAPPLCAIGFDHYMHGEVCRVDPTSTAFNLRAPGGIHTWIGAVWNEASQADTVMKWAEESWKLLQPFTGGRLYSNYVSAEDDSMEKKVFGPDTSRLSALKKKYDPDNIFKLNTNIKPG